MLANLRTKMARTAMGTNMINTPARGIKLHEYQAGALLDKWKVAIPLGETATSAEGAYEIAKKFPNGCVVKSQILGGGRGLGHFIENKFQGGVHVVDTAE
jgi:succinyl-CoA synthetase beta subunit